jgi:ubiquinone/menaquinone biosynthesis C-methylase UbiE
MPEFLNNVYRVLIPGGYFLFADFRAVHEFLVLDQELRASGFDMIAKRFITTNVVEALAFQESHKEAFLVQIENENLRDELRHFIGAKGSFVYESLKSGRMTYVSYILQKRINTPQN